MSCDQATSPVNITGNTDHTCSMKCAYSFHYPLTNLILVNKGEYLSFTPEPQTSPPVTYNNARFVVQEARLYQPSLHRWGGRQLAGEIVIVHDNVSGGPGLLVSIPVKEDGPVIDGTSILSGLLDKAAQAAPSSGANAGSITLPTFTFGKFVPYSKPYFTYVGTLPYTPCSGQYSIIVLKETSAIGQDEAAVQKMRNVITANTYVPHDNPGGLFYNSSGASNSSSSGGDIYIECHPTGADGEVMVEAQGDGPGWLKDIESKFPGIMKFIKPFFIAILAGVAAYFIWKAIGTFGTRITSGMPQRFPQDDSVDPPLKLTPQQQADEKKRQAAITATAAADKAAEQRKQQQAQQTAQLQQQNAQMQQQMQMQMGQ